MNSIEEANHQPGGSDWQRFLESLNSDSRVKITARPHFARWVTRWLDAGGDESVIATRRYFEGLGRQRNLKDWQFQQAVRAVERWAREIAELAWAGSFDWDGLAAQADALESGHRTLLRDGSGPRCVSEQSGSGVDVTEKSQSGDDFTPAHGEEGAIAELVGKTRRAIRLGGLAVATEVTYVQWISRFSRFRMR